MADSYATIRAASIHVEENFSDHGHAAAFQLAEGFVLPAEPQQSR